MDWCRANIYSERAALRFPVEEDSFRYNDENLSVYADTLTEMWFLDSFFNELPDSSGH